MQGKHRLGERRQAHLFETILGNTIGCPLSGQQNVSRISRTYLTTFEGTETTGRQDGIGRSAVIGKPSLSCFTEPA
jgi:hypothetical protein